MPDMSMIAGVFSSLNAATNITKAMIGLRDAALIQEKVVELQNVILAAQQNAFAANEERATLIERVRQLEEDVRRLETWETEKQKYELKQLDAGALAYVLKADAQKSEAPHWICAACYQRGKKFILQRVKSDFVLRHYGCPECKSQIEIRINQLPPDPPARY